MLLEFYFWIVSACICVHIKCIINVYFTELSFIFLFLMLTFPSGDISLSISFTSARLKLKCQHYSFTSCLLCYLVPLPSVTHHLFRKLQRSVAKTELPHFLMLKRLEAIKFYQIVTWSELLSILVDTRRMGQCKMYYVFYACITKTNIKFESLQQENHKRLF